MDADYATARSTCYMEEGGSSYVGQQNSDHYYCYEYALGFDVAPMDAYDKSLTQILQMTVHSDGLHADTGFTVYGAEHSFGDHITDADWVGGASLGALTTRFSLDTTAVTAAEQLVSFETVSLADTDTPYYGVELLLYSSRHAAGTAPSADEFLRFYDRTEAGTTKDPRLTITYASRDIVSTFLNGALGRTTMWPRVLTPAEVEAHMAEGMVVYDRSRDRGTVVIEGQVRTRTGALVPATHVRAGWWVHNLEADNPRPLLITGHSLDLAAGKNALTVGQDWMEDEIGVRMADLLAIPTPAPAEARVAPHAVDVSDVSAVGSEDGTAGEDGTYESHAPPGQIWMQDANGDWYLAQNPSPGQRGNPFSGGSGHR
jgi:hypothetical protein